jgi:hypothetical protein
VNADNLWPHPGPQRFVSVGGVETTDAGRFGFGLVADYLSRPVVLHVPSPLPNGSDQYAVDNQANGTFLWSYGVTRRLELDFALPVTFGQSGCGSSPITGSSAKLHDTALRDLRFGVAYQLLAREPADRVRVFGITARFDISAPVGDRDQFAGDRSAVYSPTLSIDYRRGRWFAGLELGARIRENEQVLGTTLGTQGLAALGVGYDVLARADLLAVQAEARTLPTFASQADGSAFVPSEWMVSLRSAPLERGDLSFTAGGGGAIPTGDAQLTVPRFRFLLGVRYAPSEGDRDRDGDSVPDSRDACPNVPGELPKGCPAGLAHEATPPALDLAGAADACKGDPDSVDGFKDDDGCSDEDADKDGIDDRYDRCPLESEDFSGLTEGCPEGKAQPSPPPAPKP